MRSSVKAFLYFSVLLLGIPGPIPAVHAASGPSIQGDSQTVAELNAAYKKFADANSWRSRMTLPGSPPIINTVSYVAPDRFHMVMSRGTDQPLEYYLVGNGIWLKNAAGCTRLPGSVNIPNPREMLKQSDDAVIQVTRGGTEVVEGTPTQIYNLVITSKGITVRQKLYVATATGLPRRNEVTSQQGTTVVDYSDYGAPITINNPPC
ncbi:MAG TPA: hypothetical protein VGR25_09835 [bacterium]|jgi:outer membrane lipoprotein-sorting protein|nr:hypothetical protein [bacterium]